MALRRACAILCHSVDQILCFLTRIGIRCLQALPLRWAAQLGRCGGEIVFWCDARHRRMAIANLTRCFQNEKSAAEIRALAHENFRRIGENASCAIHTAAMSPGQIKNILTVTGTGTAKNAPAAGASTNRIFATGHFGNFELFGRIASYIEGFQFAATYRGIRQPALNQLFLSLRTQPGTLLFERRTGSEALKQAMNKGGLLLVLVADQSAGDGGVEMPFFGQNCLASRAPAVMAMRYDCELFVPICYRTGLGRWTIETGDAIATRQEGKNRSSEDITRDVNAALENAVRRDPANWFWVHNRWKVRRKPAAIVTTA
jgi:KDO2-lipid IV(A) lauroyltransferase